MELSVKQIAELIEVSKPTVQKAINRLNIKPERVLNNNKSYYNYADVVTVIRDIKPDFDFQLLAELVEKPKNQTEKPQNEPQKTENQTEKPQNESQNEPQKTEKPQTAENSLIERTLIILQEQLQEKDKQLSVKDKQIQELNDRLAEASKNLAEAMALTKGQQYITAADKTTGLIEADIKRESAAAGSRSEEVQEKKSFWKRLFGN